MIDVVDDDDDDDVDDDDVMLIMRMKTTMTMMTVRCSSVAQFVAAWVMCSSCRWAAA